MAPADKAKIVILVMLIAALPLAVLYVIVADWIDQLFAGARAQLFGQVLVAILLESLPFVLLGAIVSGVLEVLVPSDRLARLVPGTACCGCWRPRGWASCCPCATAASCRSGGG